MVEGGLLLLNITVLNVIRRLNTEKNKKTKTKPKTKQIIDAEQELTSDPLLAKLQKQQGKSLVHPWMGLGPSRPA